MSALPWFRLYHRMVDDEKLRLLAFEDRWHFVALCCLKGSGLLDEPESDLRSRKIAVKLGVQVRELEEIGRRLCEVGLVNESLHPLAWDELQKRGDSSAERVQRYRENRKKAGLKPVSDYGAFKPALIARDGEACVYCDATKNLVVDHMVPISLGGCDDQDNLALACKACNSGKAGRTPAMAKMSIISKTAADCHARYVSRNGDGNALDGDIEEEEDKLEPKGSCASSDAPVLKPEHIFERWNETAASLGKPKVRDLTPERRKLLKARIAQYPLDDFLTVFGKIERSPFLRGDTGWNRCTFDWVFKKANFQKILEGNYDD